MANGAVLDISHRLHQTSRDNRVECQRKVQETTRDPTVGRSALPLEGTLKPGHRLSRNWQGDDEGGGHLE